MAPNIKNRENCDRETLLREIRAIADRCSKLVEPGFSSAEIDDLLYDEHGLPK